MSRKITEKKVSINIRVPAEIALIIEKLAEKDKRSVNSYMNLRIMEMLLSEKQ